MIIHFAYKAQHMVYFSLHALVNRAVEIEMEEIESGKTKTYSFDDIKKIIKG